MANLELDPQPASTKEEYEAFQQFLVDSKILSPPETVVPITQKQAASAERIGEDWKKRAACRGIPPKHFYEDVRPDEVKNTLAAKACAGCAVRATCIMYALQHKEKSGIWGGYDFKVSKHRAEARALVSKNPRRPRSAKKTA